MAAIYPEKVYFTFCLIKIPMLQNYQTEVLIVGAGPTGLTLALILQKLGINYIIIDKKSGTSTTSKAIGLQARVSEIFCWLELYESFNQKSSTDNYMIKFYNFEKCFFTMDLSFANEMTKKAVGKDAFVPKSLIIPQSETEKILDHELKNNGGGVLWNTEFVKFENISDEINATIISDNQLATISSKFLVSCEGGRSLVRKQSDISFKGKTYPMRFLIIDAAVNWNLSPKQVHVWFHKEGSFSAIPLPGRIWRIFIEATPNENDISFTAESLQRLMIERTGFSEAQISEIHWQSDFKINSRMVGNFRRGNIFLAGDAAHIHSPTGGQGITTGMQDAYNLGWKLSQVLRHNAPDALLDTYNEERTPVAKKVLKATEKNTRVFIGSNKFERLLRDKLILPILRSKKIQQSLLMNLTQLNFHYRKSSLSVQRSGLFNAPKIRAGDRTPDILFRLNSSNQSICMFDLYKRMKPVVLLGMFNHHSKILDIVLSREIVELKQYLSALEIDLYIVLPHTISELKMNENILIDVHDEFERLYAPKGNFTYVLRPDGYVGYFQDKICIHDLKEYLLTISTP